ncbi:gas vesicle protein GvpG [Streptomyces sioyaensis]|uniref:Gas vesicle protein n=1 Tax=Streptomyces sioyaensis TaxID=67364 RepID=A0A4Q1QSJ5_9ACTN|nr:gas vesicle protein GvpG [Streptomyces sioyaensis]MBM4792322.1 gas vesicle protein GvpG [Streptomyces sioyaensis]RXS66037.1 gas vesicle protein [Streptomyces sioyaensis]
MGLLTNILTLPLAPVRGTVWVLDQVLLTAEREYYDPEPVRQELRDMERQLLDGSMTPAEFDRREDELLDRLEWLEAHQQRLRTDS